MKPVKLEFVIFNIEHKKAEALWSAIVSLIELFGYNVSGIVIGLPEEYELPTVADESLEQTSNYYRIIAGGINRYERGK